MADLNPQHLPDGTVCCGNEAWRGRFCHYHQGLQDATPEPLTDDQKERLRELAEVAGKAHRQGFTALEAQAGREALTLLPALLDENDRLRENVTAARGETTLLRERAAHAEQERDRLRSENAELSQMVDDKLCGCGDVLAEGAKCPNCMTVDWVRYDAENERLRERIAALTETVRDVAEPLGPHTMRGVRRRLLDACQKAEEAS